MDEDIIQMAKALAARRLEYETDAAESLMLAMTAIFKRMLDDKGYETAKTITDNGFLQAEIMDTFNSISDRFFKAVYTEYFQWFDISTSYMDFAKFTDDDRLSVHCAAMASVMLMFANAGIKSATPKASLISCFSMYAATPYDNPFIRDAVRYDGLDTSEYTIDGYGFKSPVRSLRTFIRWIISTASRNSLQAVGKRLGTTLFLVGRGSSYPCQICNDMRGIRSINDLPPYHSHCCCWAYPITEIYG